MPAISIPESHKAGLKIIRGLPDEQAEDLVSALEDLPSASETSEIAKYVASRVSIPLAQVERIAATLNSLHQLRGYVEVSAAELARDVGVALPSEIGQDASATPDAGFVDRLTRLLSIPKLAVLAKVRVLERDHQFLFHDAKVVTDLRPVFGSEVSEELAGMIVSHTLKLVYHDELSGRHKEIFLVLDRKDLADLKQVISRAESKDETLRKMLSAKAINVF